MQQAEDFRQESRALATVLGLSSAPNYQPNALKIKSLWRRSFRCPPFFRRYTKALLGNGNIVPESKSKIHINECFGYLGSELANLVLLFNLADQSAAFVVFGDTFARQLLCLGNIFLGHFVPNAFSVFHCILAT